MDDKCFLMLLEPGGDATWREHADGTHEPFTRLNQFMEDDDFGLLSRGKSREHRGRMDDTVKVANDSAVRSIRLLQGYPHQ